MVEVVISEEEARGCGYRKPARDGVGVYLVGPGEASPCGRLPCELHSCPACGGGVKPSRGWNWFEPRKLIGPLLARRERAGETGECAPGMRPDCERCPLGNAMPEGRHGLIWIGEVHYAGPDDFMREVKHMGVSRKIKAVPNGFELGKTVVFLAHRKVPLRQTFVKKWVEDGAASSEPRLGPAIFSVFKPTGIDLVVADADKVPEKAVKLAEKHGARIVKVVPKPRAEPKPVDVIEQRSLPVLQGEG
jgi:hypothetical protein